MADDGSRKHSTNLERRPRRNNEVNDVTVRGVFEARAGDEKQVILLLWPKQYIF